MIAHDLLHTSQVYAQFSDTLQRKPEILLRTHSIISKGTTLE